MPGYDFDMRSLRAKQDIDDALGQRTPPQGMQPQRMQPLGPVPNPQGVQLPGNPQIGPQGATFSGQAQVGPGQLSGNATVGPQGFGGAGANYSAPVAGGQLDLRAELDRRAKLAQLMAQYQRGPFSAGVQYQPGQGVSGGMQYRQAFQEGGLATSVHNPQDYHERDVDFINTTNQHMRQMAGLPVYANGGGAWTRKEGQNPEGSLNAKGRASLKAQGHDIKPPVSAKLAAKSPKAAARRKSFCARSEGQAKMFPAAARDPDSRLNKARRKWDC